MPSTGNTLPKVPTVLQQSVPPVYIAPSVRFFEKKYRHHYSGNNHTNRMTLLITLAQPSTKRTPTMEEKNQLAVALGGRRALAKARKIKELGITPAITEDATDELIETLCKLKDPDNWETHLKGQRWYVEDLIKFSALSSTDKLNVEYTQAFPDVASEDELVSELDALA